MRLRQLAPNMTEVQVGRYTVLFSYETPVAAMMPISEFMVKMHKTERQWSRTTTGHINKWLKEQWSFTEDMIKKVATVPQGELDNIGNYIMDGSKVA